jgi:putative flippase GtrA
MTAARADSVLGLGRRFAGLPVGVRRLGAESLRYFAVSALALGCDLTIYASLIGVGITATAAGGTGYMIGIFVHFTLSTRWVFPDARGTRRTAPTLAKFVVSALIGLATTTAIIDVLTRNHVAGTLAAKAAAVVTSYVVVFLLRRTYVFAGWRS